MAAPITHIVLAQKIYNKLNLKIDEAEFIVGTTFPDIRYLGEINRDKTHILNPKLDEIKNTNAFNAGVIAHSIVDKYENNFTKSHIYSGRERSFINVSAIKLLEDELLLDRLIDLDKCISAHDGTYSEEAGFGVSTEGIKKWHQIIKRYLSQKPTDNSRKDILNGIGFALMDIKRINLQITQLRNNPQTREAIYRLYDNF